MSTATDDLKAAEAALEAAKAALEAVESHEVSAVPVEPVKPSTSASPVEDQAVAALQAAITAARSGAKNVNALRARAHDLLDQVTRV